MLTAVGMCSAKGSGLAPSGVRSVMVSSTTVGRASPARTLVGMHRPVGWWKSGIR